MLMEYQAVKTHVDWSLFSALVTGYNISISNSVITWSLKSSVYCLAMAPRLRYNLWCWKIIVLFWSLVILHSLFFLKKHELFNSLLFSAFSSKFKTRFPALVVSLYWKGLVLIRAGLLIYLDCCFWKERKEVSLKCHHVCFFSPP